MPVRHLGIVIQKTASISDCEINQLVSSPGYDEFDSQNGSDSSLQISMDIKSSYCQRSDAYNVRTSPGAGCF